jgi:hypothetical protein
VQFHVGHAFHDSLDLLTSLLNLSDQEVCLTMHASHAVGIGLPFLDSETLSRSERFTKLIIMV